MQQPLEIGGSSDKEATLAKLVVAVFQFKHKVVNGKKVDTKTRCTQQAVGHNVVLLGIVVAVKHIPQIAVCL
jgi:hypothetical protein